MKNFPKGEFFLPFFLCFTKRRKNSRQGHRRKAEKTAACGGKRIKLDCAKLLFCALIRGLQNLEASLRGFNCCGAKLRLRWAGSKFAKPRNFLRKERFSYFSRVRKVPKVHQRFANLWTPGTIQIAGRTVIVAKVTGVHQVTGYAKNCIFPGIAGNDLNRCDTPALQRKELSEHQKNCCIFCGQ
ncbi:MAG: hypothetical protein ACOYIO_04785 [Eubacteriales bacterium]